MTNESDFPEDHIEFDKKYGSFIQQFLLNIQHRFYIAKDPFAFVKQKSFFSEEI